MTWKKIGGNGEWETEVDGNRRRQLNYKKIVIALLILIFTVASIGIGISIGIKVANKSNGEESKEPEIVYPDDIKINLVATGDVMCHTTNFNAAYIPETRKYDFKPVFSNVAKYITKADIAIGNLETTFAGEDRGYTGYPTFNSPDSLGEALKNIGIDILSTANNHSLDKGYAGIERTLNVLDELGISHMGTARSKEEQETVLVKNVNGIKIAFLAFTYGTNGIPVPAGKEYSVNLLEEEAFIQKQLDLAKEQEPDIICASIHWGIEYKQKQNDAQEQLANYMFENGVDIILGNHAHVVEPMERKTVKLEDGTEKEVFVVYALGNFISGQTIEHTKSTAILDMVITKSGKDGKIRIDNVDYVPVYCYDQSEKTSNRYELIPMREAITEYESGNTENISESLYNTIKAELANTEKVLGKALTEERIEQKKNSEEN